MRNLKIKFFMSLLIAVVFGLGLSFNTNVQAQKVKGAFKGAAATQQPPYTEYKGVTELRQAREVLDTLELGPDPDITTQVAALRDRIRPA